MNETKVIECIGGCESTIEVTMDFNDPFIYLDELDEAGWDYEDDSGFCPTCQKSSNRNKRRRMTNGIPAEDQTPDDDMPTMGDLPKDDFEIFTCDGFYYAGIISADSIGNPCPNQVRVYPVAVDGTPDYYAGLINNKGWTYDKYKLVYCPGCSI